MQQPNMQQMAMQQQPRPQQQPYPQQQMPQNGMMPRPNVAPQQQSPVTMQQMQQKPQPQPNAQIPPRTIASTSQGIDPAVQNQAVATTGRTTLNNMQAIMGQKFDPTKTYFEGDKILSPQEVAQAFGGRQSNANIMHGGQYMTPDAYKQLAISQNKAIDDQMANNIQNPSGDWGRGSGFYNAAASPADMNTGLDAQYVARMGLQGMTPTMLGQAGGQQDRTYQELKSQYGG